MYLIGPYIKSIVKQHMGGSSIKNNFSLAFMTIIDLTTDWFEIIEMPTYDLDEVTNSND